MRLWKEIHNSADSVSHLARETLYNWHAAQGLKRTVSSDISIREPPWVWKRPPASWVKCNVDAACFRNEGLTGCGSILRDEHGDFIACFSKT